MENKPFDVGGDEYVLSKGSQLWMSRVKIYGLAVNRRDTVVLDTFEEMIRDDTMFITPLLNIYYFGPPPSSKKSAFRRFFHLEAAFTVFIFLFWCRSSMECLGVFRCV